MSKPTTPTPWKYEREVQKQFDRLSGAPTTWTYDWIIGADGKRAASALDCGVYNSGAGPSADFAYIVKCVNLHEELVAALDKAYSKIIELMNEGHFGKKVVFDAGFIVDALAKANLEDTP